MLTVLFGALLVGIVRAASTTGSPTTPSPTTASPSASPTTAAPTRTPPNGHAYGCEPGGVAADLTFCNVSFTFEERIQDLVSRLTLEEKIGLMSADSATNVNACNMMDHGVPRFGIPPYMHLVETNTAVASTCLAENVCSTNWPGPTGLGATFNRTLWKSKGEVMSDEIRAFNNLNWYRATGDAPYSLIGLNGYGPNLNIARDPRYGRTSELPGEDPFLTGQYAVQMVRGGQGMDAFEAAESKFLKMTLGLKHYALYGVETNRGSFIPNVTAHDLWETFLPQYAVGFGATDADGKHAGGAMGTMCSYAGANGVPSCANDYLLDQVIRGKFGRADVVVGTDCGAVNNMVSQNMFANSKLDAAGLTVNGGTDMELGDQIWAPAANGGDGLLSQAVSSGAVKSERIDASVARILNLRFLTGQFDPIEDQPYTQIGAEVVNSTAAQQLNLEAALQSFVLLKNEDGVLPMARGKRTAILGPHALSTRDLMSDYKGDEQCIGGGSDFSCFPTIAQAFQWADPATTVVEQGVDMDSNVTDGIDAALNAAANAEQVLLFLGIGNNQEHEGIDRPDTSLPGLQESFALTVIAACKKTNTPVAIVLVNGGAVAFDPVAAAAPAIVEAFYPSVRGAQALNLAIFGDENRFGKLPVTLYDKDYPNQVDFTSFDMAVAPGRTYKYFTGTPLFPFGHGLSYSTFDTSCNIITSTAISAAGWTSISCTVAVATGSVAGDEVLLVFHSVSDDIRTQESDKHPVPIKELVAFDRKHATLTTPATFEFDIGANQLGLVDENGDRQLVAGHHTVVVTNGVGFSQSFDVVVESNEVLDVVPRMP